MEIHVLLYHHRMHTRRGFKFLPSSCLLTCLPPKMAAEAEGLVTVEGLADMLQCDQLNLCTHLPPATGREASISGMAQFLTQPSTCLLHRVMLL